MKTDGLRHTPMPKWLQGMLAPTLLLWFFAVVNCVVFVLADKGRGSSPEAGFVARTALNIILALWVMTDARKRGRRLCYDYDSFIFFAWPVMVPVYLFQTRGIRAFLTLLCFAGIWLMAALVAYLVSLFLKPT